MYRHFFSFRLFQGCSGLQQQMNGFHCKATSSKTHHEGDGVVRHLNHMLRICKAKQTGVYRI